MVGEAAAIADAHLPSSADSFHIGGAPTQDVPITSAQFTVLRLDTAIDAWVRDVAVVETQNDFVIGSSAKRVTFERVGVAHPAPHSGAAAPADFSIAGTQILLDRCSVGGGPW
jgi:hypothetical protein